MDGIVPVAARIAETLGISAAAAGLICGGVAYAARWPTSQIFGETLIAGPDIDPAHHAVALTYDDGPSPANTPALLDLLAAHNARATFFLVGAHVRRFPALARSIADAGHTIGNHTVNHPDLARKDSARIHDELTGCQHILEDATGVQCTLFRPPYGSRRPAVLRIARALGVTPVLWNVTAKDWLPIGADAILTRCSDGIARNRKRRVGSNILLHDASQHDAATTFTPRADTLTVTRALLMRDDLSFVSPLEWNAKNGTGRD